jgi:hypothetical protein
VTIEFKILRKENIEKEDRLCARDKRVLEESVCSGTNSYHRSRIGES